MLFDEYIEQLKGTANGYVQYLNSELTIDVNLAVMGYSTQMLKQLAEMNGMRELYLEEGEALFLNRTTSTQDILHAETKNCEGEKYSFQTNLFDENKQTFYMAETSLVDMVKTLPVYPVLDKNSLCMIIDLESYNHWFNSDFVNSFYVGHIEREVLEQIQELLLGINFIRVIDQQEEYRSEKASYHQKIFLLIVMMVICFFLSGVNILMQGIYEMDTRQKSALSFIFCAA